MDARFAAFLGVTALLILTPGPDMALVTKNALRFGTRAASFTALGVAAGILGWALALVAGVGVLLEQSAIAFAVLKLAGAAYLAYFGIRTFLSSFRQAAPAGLQEPDAPSEQLDRKSAFRQGLAGNLLNPKAGVIFVSILPQFVRPGDSSLRLLAMFLSFEILLLAWLFLYGRLIVRAGDTGPGLHVRRALDRATGVVLVALGVRLALESR